MSAAWRTLQMIWVLFALVMMGVVTLPLIVTTLLRLL
jgi:hypothetical protein